MKLVQLLVTVLLLVGTSAVHGASVKIINLEDSDFVNEKGFLVVAKAKGFKPVNELRVLVALQNESDGLEGHVYADGTEDGCVFFPPMDDILVSFKTLGAFCHGNSHNFTIVAEVDEGGFMTGDWVQVHVHLYSPDYVINEYQQIRVLVR
jgi:hypothetical protein